MARAEAPYRGRPGVSPVVAALYAAGLVGGGSRVLDVGCGVGTDVIGLASWGVRRAVGVDVDVSAIAAARRQAARLGLAGRAEFRVVSADRLQETFAAGEFNVAIDTLCVNNLDGELEERAYARAVAHCVRPGGILLVSERVSPPVWRRGLDAMVPPAGLSRYFAVGPAVPSHLPERPARRGGSGHAVVLVRFATRNRRPAPGARRPRRVPREPGPPR